jgi:hypothetical protein
MEISKQHAELAPWRRIAWSLTPVKKSSNRPQKFIFTTQFVIKKAKSRAGVAPVTG